MANRLTGRETWRLGNWLVGACADGSIAADATVADVAAQAAAALGFRVTETNLETAMETTGATWRPEPDDVQGRLERLEQRVSAIEDGLRAALREEDLFSAAADEMLSGEGDA